MVQHYLLLARRQQEEEEEEAAAAAAAAGDLNLISLGAYLHPSLHPVSPRLHFHPPHPRLSCLLLLLLLLLRSFHGISASYYTQKSSKTKQKTETVPSLKLWRPPFQRIYFVLLYWFCPLFLSNLIYSLLLCFSFSPFHVLDALPFSHCVVKNPK